MPNSSEERVQTAIKLKVRFPQHSDEEIRKALADSGWHAGYAAKALGQPPPDPVLSNDDIGDKLDEDTQWAVCTQRSTGREYYYNFETKERSWAAPDLEKEKAEKAAKAAKAAAQSMVAIGCNVVVNDGCGWKGEIGTVVEDATTGFTEGGDWRVSFPKGNYVVPKLACFATEALSAGPWLLRWRNGEICFEKAAPEPSPAPKDRSGVYAPEPAYKQALPAPKLDSCQASKLEGIMQERLPAFLAVDEADADVLQALPLGLQYNIRFEIKNYSH